MFLLKRIKNGSNKESEQEENQAEWKNNKLWYPEENIKNKIPKIINTFPFFLPSFFCSLFNKHIHSPHLPAFVYVKYLRFLA
jgi:hypothetical protein